MIFRTYESINIGDTSKLIKKIEEEDIKKFVDLTGDNNPLHIDKEYAEKTSFKDIVVHGMLSASFISTIIGTQLPGEGALWISQTLDFLLPVRLGDEITVLAKVLSKNDKERVLELETQVLNQHGQVVLNGKGKVRVLEKTIKKIETSKERQKNAIVTGASGGIGRAICIKLAEKGYNILVNYNSNSSAADSLVNELQKFKIQAKAVQADVSIERDAQHLIQSCKKYFGGVSLIVNNASPKIHPKAIENLVWSEFEKHIDVQLKGSFLLSQSAIALFKEQKYGKIINIGSQEIDGAPTNGWLPYAIGKASIATLTRYLAAELGPFGIQVNTVSPGMTDTGFIRDIPEKLRLIIERQTPLRRLATPDDVAQVVAFLASEEANYITGETIRVNGGAVMR